MGDLVDYEVRLCCAVTRGEVELFAVYAGIASGRMLVVSAPAAGKSGTAVVTGARRPRTPKRVEDEDRAQVPVPVLLIAHSRDPTTWSV